MDALRQDILEACVERALPVYHERVVWSNCSLNGIWKAFINTKVCFFCDWKIWGSLWPHKMLGGIQTYSFSYIAVPFRWSEAQWEQRDTQQQKYHHNIHWNTFHRGPSTVRSTKQWLCRRHLCLFSSQSLLGSKWIFIFVAELLVEAWCMIWKLSNKYCNHLVLSAWRSSCWLKFT